MAERSATWTAYATEATTIAYPSPWSIIAAETDYGGTPCTLKIMGSSSAILHFGSGASPGNMTRHSQSKRSAPVAAAAATAVLLLVVSACGSRSAGAAGRAADRPPAADTSTSPAATIT